MASERPASTEPGTRPFIEDLTRQGRIAVATYHLAPQAVLETAD